VVGEGLKERLATGWNVLGGEERRERKRGGEEKKKKRKIASGSETGGHRAGSSGSLTQHCQAPKH
jgi:hypothetical protein